MAFTSFDYLALLAVVFAAYWLAQDKGVRLAFVRMKRRRDTTPHSGIDT